MARILIKLLLIGFLLPGSSIVSYAQCYMGPYFYRIDLRIFSPEGNLIGDRNSGYAVSIPESYLPKHPEDTTYVLRINGRSLAVSQLPAPVNIIHGRDTMELLSEMPLDSWVIRKGKYYIPADYTYLFNFRAADGVRILNSEPDSFRVKSIPYINGEQFGQSLRSSYRFIQRAREGDFIGAGCLENTWNPEFEKEEPKQSFQVHVWKDGYAPRQVLGFPMKYSCFRPEDMEVASARLWYMRCRDQKLNRDIMLVSRDSGQNWSVDSFLTGNKIKQLRFVDGSTGFALVQGSDHARLFRTVNGGKNWKQVFGEIKGDDIRLLFFSADGHGYISRAKTVSEGLVFDVFETKDSGAGWVQFSPGITPVTYPLIECAGQILYFSSGAALFRSDDQGKSWKPVIHNIRLSELHFPDESTGIVRNQDFLLYTKDGGKTWSYEVVEPKSFSKYDFLIYPTYYSRYSYRRGFYLNGLRNLPDKDIVFMTRNKVLTHTGRVKRLK